jgi:hypothetical protein
LIAVLTATAIGFGCAATAHGAAADLKLLKPDTPRTKVATFSGTASLDPGDSSTVVVNVYSGPAATGTPIQAPSATVKSDGSWSVDASPALLDGTYTAEATQLLNGNVTPTKSAPPRTFTIDVTAPAPTITAPDASTTDTTPGLKGGAGTATGDLPEVNVKIYAGSTPSGAVVQELKPMSSTGSWSAAAAEMRIDTYTAQATQSDDLGNVGTSPAHTFTITTPSAPAPPPPPPPNLPPTASFVALPGSPLTGDQLTVVSTSSDPDGPIASYAWDLNGDGIFRDGSGSVAQTSFATPGPHTVSLRVTDAGGAGAVSSQRITVSARPLPALQLLSPFPVVRIAGRATGLGVNLRLVSAEAPAGSRVTLTCRGRTCPRRSETRVAPGSASVGRLRVVTFPRFARSLRSGVVLEIRVTKSGRIGKYTRFVIQRNRAPRRSDSCLLPGGSAPKACPAS